MEKRPLRVHSSSLNNTLFLEIRYCLNKLEPILFVYLERQMWCPMQTFHFCSETQVKFHSFTLFLFTKQFVQRKGKGIFCNQDTQRFQSKYNIIKCQTSSFWQFRNRYTAWTAFQNNIHQLLINNCTPIMFIAIQACGSIKKSTKIWEWLLGSSFLWFFLWE